MRCGSLCSDVVFPSLPASRVWVLLVCVSLCGRVGAAPVCANAQAGCHVLPLANLFDRVIQHSARMHGISNDLHAEFVSRTLIICTNSLRHLQPFYYFIHLFALCPPLTFRRRLTSDLCLFRNSTSCPVKIKLAASVAAVTHPPS